ncbi:MAG: hypothetical protein MJZ41_07560 [Bacteroidaceae bacterium]|nr:hypothetical protein [Bacteroidaceae bacterium]
MPITRTGSHKTIEAWIDRRFESLSKSITKAFHDVGLQAVTIAQTSHRYEDRTGNLTDSIGYVIVQDGRIIDESSFLSKGSQGSYMGRKYAEELASKHTKGIFFVIFAAMPYAEYVEAKGLNVLDAARVYAHAEIKNKIASVLKRFTQ